jgi:hypothetical protein
MERPTNRLLRRAQGIKRARKVLYIWKSANSTRSVDLYSDGGPLEQKLLNNRSTCSCPWCGNPRRHFHQRTRKEIISDIDMQDQIKEPAN